jgi:hypothetical protein
LYNYQICECTYFPAIQIAYDAQNTLRERITKISQYTIDTMKLYEYRVRLYELDNELQTFIGDVEYEFSKKHKAELELSIKEFERRVKTIITESDEYSETTTKCKHVCDDPKAVLCNDCVCRVTSETRQFRDLFESFLAVEKDIWTYRGKGFDSEEYRAFRERTKQARIDFQTMFEHLVSNNGNYDQSTIAEYVKKISASTTSLASDFEAWKNKVNPSDECKLAASSCAASEVADQRACKCVFVKDYDKLQGILDKYQEYVDSIKALTIDDKNRDIFLGNL